MFDGTLILLCKKLCQQDGFSHYHCLCVRESVICKKIFVKRIRLRKHLETMLSGDSLTSPKGCNNESLADNSLENVSEAASEPVNGPQIQVETDNPIDVDFQISDNPVLVASKTKCIVCGVLVTKKNLKRHLQIHEPAINPLEGSCFDANQGIYLINENKCGVAYPVHVQKYISGNKPSAIFCESKDCESQKIISGISGKPTFECIHLLSVPHCRVPPSVMKTAPSFLKTFLGVAS